MASDFHGAQAVGPWLPTDARTGSLKAGTVSVVDLKTFEVREIDVGLAPSMMALNRDGSLVAAANGHSDSR